MIKKNSVIKKKHGRPADPKSLQKPKKPPSYNRLVEQELFNKFKPSMKVLSKQLVNTRPDPPERFEGYKLLSGDYTDALGRNWQIQVQAVCNKKCFTKKKEVEVMISGNTFGIKARMFIKALIEWAYKA